MKELEERILKLETMLLECHRQLRQPQTLSDDRTLVEDLKRDILFTLYGNIYVNDAV